MSTYDSSTRNALSIEAGLERTLIAEQGDTAWLMIKIAAPADDRPRKRAPIDVAFALDRSGSMQGEPLTLVKQAVSFAIGQLSAEDRVSLVVYDDNIDLLQPLTNATPAAITGMRMLINHIQSRGSTNLGGGWLTACDQLAGAASSSEVRVKRSILLTDGLANVGIVDAQELTGHARQLRSRGVPTSTMGVGEGFDELLLSGMAEAGGGSFAYVAEPAQIRDFFQRELGDLLKIAATGLHVGFRFPAGFRVSLLNPYPVSYGHGRIDVAIGDLPAGDELTLIFKLSSPAGMAGTVFPIHLRAKWRDMTSGAEQRIEQSPAALTIADAAAVSAAPVDPAIATLVAQAKADELQREAMRLDREGRYAERSHLLHQARSTYASAPLASMNPAYFAELDGMASFSVMAPMSSDARKSVLHRTHRRFRGKQD